MGRRRGLVLLLLTGFCWGGLLPSAPGASAHPLGNATVNHYDGLRLYPDHIDDTAVEDVAEIPTLQRRPLIDGDRDGRLSTSEMATYARRQCAALVAAERITVGGSRLRLRAVSAQYGERPGAVDLTVGRLVCLLTAPAGLSEPITVSIDDEWDGAGIGWHELTAVGRGVSLHDSPVPPTSISDELRHYPNDLLSSPIDQRTATLQVVPGANGSTYAGTPGLPTAGGATRLLDHLATTFNGLVGRRHPALGVGLLAVLLAMVLGAGHAFLPGHGKTIMAAYLVGKRGRMRDAVTVGATVTMTHTAGVLLIGLLLSLSARLAPTVVEQDLAVLSGVIVAGVGLWLLIGAVRRRTPGPTVEDELATLATVATESLPVATPAAVSAHAERGDAASPGPHHDIPQPDHQHGRGHESGHRHGPQGHHSRGHAHPDATAFSGRGLVGLGIAGGLVPSPSALLVLLATVALGRTVFGVVLVVSYGVGMAVALTAAGLLLVRLRGRLGRLAGGVRLRRVRRLAHALPALTAMLVLVVGIGLVLQALTGRV